MVKTIYWIQHTKKTEAEKNKNENGKALYKLLNNAIYGKKWKTWETCETRKQRKRLFKMYIKTKLLCRN